MQPVLILWTCATEQEAKTIVRALLQSQWIACANIIYPIASMYSWKGNIEEELEAKVLLKTFDCHYEAIRLYIQEHGSYDIPEVSEIVINTVNPDYLEWMKNACICT